MGSGNSSPVKQAKTVETEAHQDMFEIRFDHLAWGGTAFFIIILALAFYWSCKSMRKRKPRNQQSHLVQSHQCCQGQPPICPQMMPPYQQWPIPINQFLPAMTNQWIPMEMIRPQNIPTAFDNTRFTEIQESRTPTPAGNAPPARPPQPRLSELPSPHRGAAGETA